MKRTLLFALLAAVLCISCNHPHETIDYRGEMRNFVIRISQKAKQQRPGFIVIPQNGIELLFNGTPDEGQWATEYVAAINGCAQEDLNYGYPNMEAVTPNTMTQHWLSYLEPFQQLGKVLVIDYCAHPDNSALSYQLNANRNFISYAAPSRELDLIPTTSAFQENALDIQHLSEARNFLYIINPQNYSSKASFITAIRNTNYDVVVVDLFFNEEMLTASDVAQLQVKANGGKRLVICYMSIGEAESYRYYWQKGWRLHKPAWLDRVNPDWAGNYKVHYWNPEWQEIICGDGDSYLNRILAAGFDGVHLDIIDAFEYYENR